MQKVRVFFWHTVCTKVSSDELRKLKHLKYCVHSHPASTLFVLKLFNNADYTKVTTCNFSSLCVKIISNYELE